MIYAHAMLRRLAILGAAAAALALPAAAQAGDASTTTAYLRADYALVRAGWANIHSSVSGYRGVLAGVRRSCPLAAHGSPQDPESTELSNEVIGAMVLAAGRPDLAAIRSYLGAVSGLRWSSASVTRAVSGYAAKLRRLYGLKAPDLCGDVSRWAGSGFHALPASTLSFDRVFYPNWVALGLVPGGLGRFESGAARTLAHNAEGLEYKLTNVEAEAVETWGDIMNALELNP